MTDERPLEAQLIENAPGLARVAATMWWRATRWGMIGSVQTGARLARMAAEPVLATQVVAELGSQLREYARDLLGITELDQRVTQLVPPATGASSNGSRNGASAERIGLRAQGAQLLRAAAEIDADDDQTHPAYARILTELAPDEGRILRLLATEGAQASVDIRASKLLGVSSQLTAAGLTMIGAQAGCQHRERVPAYLNNLERLGLIWFSREPMEDAIAYQVLEAQPDVLAATKGASRAKVVQRSIHLTPFGQDFCWVCLPLETEGPQTAEEFMDSE